ncbi:hypothetical protein RYH74_07830 [Pseudomonas sp. LSJ-87]|uniref:hypothetical protein n=1 Tax=Pseudomonas sp. LSJ-87 TaxID=3079932 RepID=UPI002940C64F|nr:hypothetical protein [Pseudomonas sp. LSJ-87]MDV5097198.1 hypothetical protein [Pseudomonas sp. LSJ-87]
MINPSSTNAMWLIDDNEVGPAFDLAMSDARHRFWKIYGVPNGGRQKELLESLNKSGIRPFSKLTRPQVDELVYCCFKHHPGRESIIAELLPSVAPERIQQLSSVMKIAFIRLWIERKVILPIKWQCPIHCDRILDDMIKEQIPLGNCPLLAKIRGINPYSSIGYTGPMSLKNRELRSTFWLRLVLGSNLYEADNFTAENARDLILRSFGARSELGRFYTDDFSLFVADAASNEWLRPAIDKVLSENREELMKSRALKKTHFKETKSAKAHRAMVEKTLEFLEGSDHSVAKLAQTFGEVRHVRKAFGILKDEELPGGLTLLPQKVVDFCKMITSTFNAFIRSRRIQRPDNYNMALSFLIAYCGPYLFKYFMNRDGNLNDYPTTFNDFTCALYITADHDLLTELNVLKKSPPETLLKFIAELIELNELSADTHYHRVYPLDDFIDYIISQAGIIPHSDQVRNSFSTDCYPLLRKRSGTVKKTVPRAYFATFLSMLNSLEYLTMHLNEMADGKMNGLVQGELKIPNINELMYSSEWAGLWGIKGQSCQCIDFSALNFTPIFYYDGKPRRFEYIPKFYRISDTHIDGLVQQRVVMNDIRITQLMCETGIRQKHLLWLDLDRYKTHAHNLGRPLDALLVSTDKSHGEWTAIVSKRVMDLLERQSSWYERCTSPEYKERIWYSFQKNSSFGKLRPLFRLHLNQNSWANYESYHLILLCLDYFIKTEVGDTKQPSLVWLKPANRTDEPGDIEDYSIEGLSRLTSNIVTSDCTPHGLRAGFVSEAIKFLPPSLVGQWLTGQSEPLVNYYSIFDPDDIGMSHQQMLCNALMSNQDKISTGDLPDLAAAISSINQKILGDIIRNPEVAISKHKLMSLSNGKNENGLDRLIAKEVSELAFNPTHICPFNNICPSEVVALFGEKSCCSACPYAIRGVAHLPAISARKDKYKELLSTSLKLIEEYLTRKPSARIREELEQMELENDRFAREACLLETIEQELISMHDRGQDQDLAVKNREEILIHYDRLNLTEESGLLKRLIDVQNFPDASSEDLTMRLAHLRHALLMRDGDIAAFLGVGENKSIPLHTKVARQISTMIKSGAIDEFELFGISAGGEDTLKQLAVQAATAPRLTQMVM